MSDDKQRTIDQVIENNIKSDKDPLMPAYVFEEDYAGGSSKYIRKDIVTKAMEEYASLKLKEKDELIDRLEKEKASLNKIIDGYQSEGFGKNQQLKVALKATVEALEIWKDADLHNDQMEYSILVEEQLHKVTSALEKAKPLTT
jgi:intein/homing endonuclease